MYMHAKKAILQLREVSMMKAETSGVGRQYSTDAGRVSSASVWRQAVWLGAKEIRRSWLSYPVTGLAMLIIGLLTASAVNGMNFEEPGEGSLRIVEWYNAFFPDFLFLTFGMFLALNWLAREYFRVFSRDAFSERLIFMRSLPISSQIIIASRMISMCFALLFTVPAFFAPIYLLTDLGGLGWSYVWFVLIWVGYSLLGAGLWLLAEFGVQGKTYVVLSFASIPLIVGAVALLEWSIELRAFERLAGLAQNHGPVTAIVALVIGALGFAAMARATTRRIESRDLSA